MKSVLPDEYVKRVLRGTPVALLADAIGCSDAWYEAKSFSTYR